jgi:hypothetical protein
MTDPLHGGELVKHHTGNLSLELKHPDGRKEVCSQNDWLSLPPLFLSFIGVLPLLMT